MWCCIRRAGRRRSRSASIRTTRPSLWCGSRCSAAGTRGPMTIAGVSNVAVARTPILEAAALSKRYGEQHALDAVSFDVRAGEVLGLIGPNGAGKTTLLEALAGLLPIDGGAVRWRGSEAGRRRDEVFYLPDGLRPWEDQYVVRVLGFFASVYGRTDAEVTQTVDAVGLSPVLGKRVAALSKGYGRRLMLALALITPQPLLLMD